MVSDRLVPSPEGASRQQWGPVRLEAEGFRVFGHRSSGRLFRYEDVTHLGIFRCRYGIGLPDGIILRRISEWGDDESITEFDAALRQRIAQCSGGSEQLIRMEQVEELFRQRGSRRAVHGFTALCLAAWLFQTRDSFLTHVGSFSAELFLQGEFWRVMTANFLHDMTIFPLHMALNLICILLLGKPVERILGSTRTFLVMTGGALGAMLGSIVAGYAEVIGASGVAAGLVGALLCLELEGSRWLPVWWRIPRRFFFGLLLGQALIDWMLPAIAGAAHLGGLLAGYGVTRLFLADIATLAPAKRSQRRLALAMGAALGLSIVLMIPLLQRDQGALERHGLRLLRVTSASVRSDNELAWRMLTESQATPMGMEVAAALAQRAADHSDWRDPNVLDTLAEALFALGDTRGALDVIEVAIDLSGGQRYFIEQRRRFNGERDPEDRPTPPGESGSKDPWDGEPFEAPTQEGEDSESVWI